MHADWFVPLIRSGSHLPAFNREPSAFIGGYQISDRVIGCALTVANAPYAGFLETAYQNALLNPERKATLTPEFAPSSR